MSVQNNLAQSSKGQYAGRNKLFVLWLWASSEHRSLLNEAWLEDICKQLGERVPDPGVAFSSAVEKEMVARLAIKDANAIAPVHYSDRLVDAWLQFMHSLDVEFATQCSYRSAFGHIWKNFHAVDVGVPSGWRAKISSVFNGLGRAKAAEKASGKRGRPEKGKRALEFKQYGLLCENAWGLKGDGKNRATANPFMALFMILSWNLMSRSKNITSIAFSHLSWENDSLTIMFCVTKTNQAGRNMHPRHVYANPLQPHICPILALGVYLMVNSFGPDNVSLFPGQKQYDRFAKLLKVAVDALLKSYSVELESFRLYGTHSFRKGGATFTCSGSTAAPHISAVSIRIGWKQPGVQDTYLVYANAGDQYVGRIVAGLPLNSPEFTILPPFFAQVTDEVMGALDLCFPSFRGEDRIADQVLFFCLASVVYHRTWLRENLPDQHPIFRTPLFVNEALLEGLGTQVECRLPEAGDALKATGIPPHVDQMYRFHKVEAKLETFCAHLDQKCDTMVDGLLRGLDERQLESHLTPTGLRNQLRVMIDELGLSDLRNLLSENRRVRLEDHSNLERPVGPPALQVYSWDGLANRLLPEDFEFPRNATVRDMWVLYIVGIPAKGIRPLKDIGRDHFRLDHVRKRACEFFQLMSCMVRYLRDIDGWEASNSVEAAIRMFESARPCLLVSASSTRKYHRRVDQLGWRRAHDLVVRNVEKRGQRPKVVASDISGGDSDDNGSDIVGADDDGASNMADSDDDDELVGDVARSSGSARSRSPPRKVGGPVAGSRKRQIAMTPEQQILEYAQAHYGLSSNAAVSTDGSCLFSAAAFQLDLVFPASRPHRQDIVRARVVDWLLQRNIIAEDVLQSAGYDSVNAWERHMRQPRSWGDELCVQGICGAFGVRVRLIANGDVEAHERIITSELDAHAEAPLITLGCSLDIHFYSLEPSSAPTASSVDREVSALHVRSRKQWKRN